MLPWYAMSMLQHTVAGLNCFAGAHSIHGTHCAHCKAQKQEVIMTWQGSSIGLQQVVPKCLCICSAGCTHLALLARPLQVLLES